MMIEDIVGSYGKSDKYQIGDFCLISPPPEETPDVNRRRILFVRDCTAFAINSDGFDVSPFARYLDKKYNELTEELNSPPTLRKWAATDIENEIEAKYLSSTDKEVTLEKGGGEVVKMEFSKLSKQDQLYVQRRQEIAHYEAEEKASKTQKDQPKPTK